MSYLIEDPQTTTIAVEDDVKWTAITNPTKALAVKEWIRNKAIGKGVYGNVYEASKGSNTGYVMKISKLNLLYEKMAFDREVYFLKKLNSFDTLAPKMHAFWNTDNEGFIVMDRWTGDVTSLLTVLENEVYEIPFWAWERIHSLIHELTKFKIIHNDLKFDNFLYKKETREICICDFGVAVDYEEFKPIAGLSGWLAKYNCSNPSIFTKTYNLWSLDIYLRVLLGARGKLRIVYPQRTVELRKLPELSDDLREAFDGYCAKPTFV